jgi:Tol biopolymer transport system component
MDMNSQESKQVTLESWKEIAAYLQRDAKTARRWEKEEGLPIHRHSPNSRSSVYAYPTEIDAWRVSRKVVAPEAVPTRSLLRFPAFALTALLCLIMVGNGIRPQTASAQQKRALAKRLLCSGCGDLLPADLSRDGRLMVFTDWAAGDIAIRDMSTGKVKRLFAKPATPKDSQSRAAGPLFSSDLRQIVYLWALDEQGQHAQLRLMPNEPGGKSRILIDSLTDPYVPAGWFPDGKSVLLMHVKAETEAQLVRATLADGAMKVIKSGDLRRLYYNAGSRPGISPDGRYIVYSALAVSPSKAPPAATDRKDTHIYVLAADGSSETEIVKTAGTNKNAVWTPDGKHILFTSDRSGKVDLWSIAVENGKAAGSESLVSADVGEIDAVGLYGGSYYYATSQVGAEYVNIAEFAPSGNGQNRLTRATESFVGIRPTWSPDGKSIAFKRHHPGLENEYDLVVRSLEIGDERTYPTNLGTTGYGGATWLHDGQNHRDGSWARWLAPELPHRSENRGVQGADCRDSADCFFP